MSDDVKDVLHAKELVTNDISILDDLTIGSLDVNGSANVSVTNVAPAGVGTATISKWLKVIEKETGTWYYIPMWT